MYIVGMKLVDGSINWLGLQLKDMRAGGAEVFWRKVRSAFRILHLWEIVNGIWALPTVLMIRALRSIVLIRMGTLNTRRIGHFSADGAEQVGRLQQQLTNTVDWFWLSEPCNKQWDRMMRRSLPVHSWAKHLDWWNRALPGGSVHERPDTYTMTRDVEGVYARHDVKVPFTPAETDEALAWLRDKGWSDGQHFVCLLVRDHEYLRNDPLHGKGADRAEGIWSYHNYRNTDIVTYIPAIQWLAEQGVWVIRMGKLMAEPLPTHMEHVIDYAFDNGKSDLLDIWLFANCAGCVTTGTGPDGISSIYGVPLLFVNFSPLGQFWSYANSISVPKPLRWMKDKEPLTIHEHLSNGYIRQSEYEASGIDVVDMAPEDILLAFQEFWGRRTDTWKEEPGDARRQQDFWEALLASSENGRFHGWRHPNSRIGAAWLKALERQIASSSPINGDILS